MSSVPIGRAERPLRVATEGSTATRRERVQASAYAGPAFGLYAFFAGIPLVLVFVLAFTNYSSSSATGGFTWAGAANWTRLASDPVVRGSVGLTALVMALSWVLQTGLGLLLGVFLAGRPRYRSVLGTLFFLPIVFSPVAVAIAWENLFAPYYGGIALTLQHLPGSLAADWLAIPGQAIYVVIAVIAWQGIPFQTILFMAAARQIPGVLYDAALIDGAGRFRSFLDITVPQLRYAFATSSILVLVLSLLSFEMFLVMTNGGPGTSTTVLSLAMYQRGFVSSQEAYGSAIAAVLAVMGLVLSLLVVRVTGFGSMRSQREGL